MTIELITAISNFQVEDAVIESLTQREFRLHFRAFTWRDLEDELKTCQEDQRYLLVMDESFAINLGEIRKYLSESISYLVLNGDSAPSPELLFELAYERLRRVEAVKQTQIVRSRGNAIGFTGSWASPGISSVAINVAAELSTSREVLLNDVNPLRRDLMHLLGLKRDQHKVKMNNRLSVVDHNSDHSDDESPLLHPESLNILDLGSAPDIELSLSDRRAPGRSFAEFIHNCRELVFVIGPESHALQQMESFSMQLQSLIPNIKVTYVLNRLGSSSRHQGIKRSFQKKVNEFGSDQRSFLIPADYSLMDRAQGRFASVLEVSPRSALRRAYQELAVYLDK
ncbi:MAG: hypothetical protein RL239_788 [Actinomycetota bacterium]